MDVVVVVVDDDPPTDQPTIMRWSEAVWTLTSRARCIRICDDTHGSPGSANGIKYDVVVFFSSFSSYIHRIRR